MKIQLLNRAPTSYNDEFMDAMAQAFAVDRKEWRTSVFRGLRSLERLAGPRFELFRYRLCIRGRTPA